MADQFIRDLTGAASLSPTDNFIVDQGGDAKKASFQQIKTGILDALVGATSGLQVVTPTGTPNGVLTQFTLPITPVGGVLMFMNGVAVNPADYSVASTTITFTAAPLTGAVLTAVTGVAGGGGTKTYAFFTALDFQPPASLYAIFDTRNSIAVLNFSDAAIWSAFAVGVIPEAVVLTSGLIVNLHWLGITATTGNVRWRVEIERMNTDLDADSFDTAVEATGACNATCGIETVTSITVPTIDGITAGDLYRLRVSRVGSDATNDTMAGYAQLLAVEVRSAN